MTSLLRRLSVALFLFAVVIPSVRCGFLHSNLGVGDLGLATEDELSSGRSPQQLSVQVARVLPKPEFGVTPEVQVELDRFMKQDRGTVERVLQERAAELEKMEEVFAGQGVPRELLTVAAVESGLNPKAASPAGAKGMWQFMRATAQSYGLKVNSKQDDRLDPERSTVAAAKHLRDLFTKFNDWHLVLAAYNAGSGAVGKVLARNSEADFWNLARGGEFPGETRRFVPRVIALSLIVSNPDQYGFSAAKIVG
jgi:membrane-bound lytic murein transglycosylase D